MEIRGILGAYIDEPRRVVAQVDDGHGLAVARLPRAMPPDPDPQSVQTGSAGAACAQWGRGGRSRAAETKTKVARGRRMRFMFYPLWGVLNTLPS